MVWLLNKFIGVARHHLQEFQQVRRCPSNKVRAQRPRWKPLDAGFVKAKFDGGHAHGIIIESLMKTKNNKWYGIHRCLSLNFEIKRSKTGSSNFLI